ncbi:hypothetical protein DPMN_159923, partial [Dreissena polymorpha]
APSATSLLAHTPMSAAFAGVHTQLTNAPSSQRNTLPEPPPPPNPLHSINKPNKTAVIAKFKERAPLMDQLPTTIPEYLFII